MYFDFGLGLLALDYVIRILGKGFRFGVKEFMV
jgi:hypothetical protein